MWWGKVVCLSAGKNKMFGKNPSVEKQFDTTDKSSSETGLKMMSEVMSKGTKPNLAPQVFITGVL